MKRNGNGEYRFCTNSISFVKEKKNFSFHLPINFWRAMWPAQQDLHQEQRTTGWLQMDLPNEPTLTSGESHLLSPLFSHLIYLERCFHFPHFCIRLRENCQGSRFPQLLGPILFEITLSICRGASAQQEPPHSFFYGGRTGQLKTQWMQANGAHPRAGIIISNAERVDGLFVWCSLFKESSHNAITQPAERKTHPQPYEMMSYYFRSN